MKSLAKSIVYGAVDLCTGWRGVRRVINGEPIRFPARWCRYYPAGYEPEKFRFLRAHCRPGDTVLDIGARIGLYTVLMARCVGPGGRVFSFEPTPQTTEVLRETVRLNHCQGTVEVVGKAVSSTTGSVLFYDTGSMCSNANIMIRWDGIQNVVAVETVTVDDLVASRELTIHCMKIDVEGAELEVLRGAARTIATCRPAIKLEIHPEALLRSGGSLHDLWELLKEYRLLMYMGACPVEEGWLCERRGLFEVQLLPGEKALVLS